MTNQEKTLNPTAEEVGKIIQLGQGRVILTGSVALGLHQGLSLAESIERANDIDLVKLPLSDPLLLVAANVEEINRRHDKQIICIDEPKWVTESRIRPQDVRLIETETGKLPVETIERMCAWEREFLHIMDDDFHPGLREERQQKLLRNYELLKRINPLHSRETSEEDKNN